MNKLEQTMDHILKKYGHDILLIHTGGKERCSCYDPATGSVNTKKVRQTVNGKTSYKVVQMTREEAPCPYCMGTGWVSTIKRYTTRYKDARIPQSNAFMEQQMGFGEMSVEAKLYYFDKHTTVTEGDIILEVDWEGDRPIYNGGGAFEVSHVDPLRYIGGKINHYRVYTKSDPIDVDIKGIRIVKKAGEVQYELAEKGSHKIINPNPVQEPKDSVDTNKPEDNISNINEVK